MSFECGPRGEVQSILQGGRWCLPPKSGPWWVLWVWIFPWFVLTPKVLKLCTNHLVFGFVQVCVSSWCLSFFLVPSSSSSTPLYPRSVVHNFEKWSRWTKKGIITLELNHLGKKWWHITSMIMYSELFISDNLLAILNLSKNFLDCAR